MSLADTLTALVGKASSERMLDLIARKDQAPIQWDRVIPLPENQTSDYTKLPEVPKDKLKDIVKKVALVKLNGGLGTTMGLSGPKCMIVVKEKKSFLELVLEQVQTFNKEFECSLPLVLMNSFNTETETKRVTSAYTDVDVIHFNQHQFPRLRLADLIPLAKDKTAPGNCWYPPGHGDIYDSLKESGTLDMLIKRGIEYIFISNIDNLGATFDERILYQLIESKADVLMELTPKTPIDVKGGTVINYPRADGSIGYRLLEIAQVPGEHVQEFKSMRKFSMFNSGNLWVRLGFIDDNLKTNTLQLDTIKNTKVIEGEKVLQLETACGAIVSLAKTASIVCVPRSRFIPTKSCGDLILIMSNFYEWRNGRLLVSPRRGISSMPVISLGPCYAKIQDIDSRCPSPPGLVDLESLTIVGDVTFQAGVELKGNIVIVPTEGKKLVIPAGSVLDNCTVTGCLSVIPRV
ncbi:putative UTP--glucose-1-phosphate uridylyltransferase [Blattamonas nauphoetae]|uniref:UTP--glucose-1-phosphate uridylyltransferase n=1 Tax=Blattamonas nauphoetae TaxID=2049346 RepID=A0ABQ9Y9S4_9EUKA|nr:putative UTP--glucose-1-phosphate uridylyltransferase [Blattamonas nauphoetae]